MPSHQLRPTPHSAVDALYDDIEQALLDISTASLADEGAYPAATADELVTELVTELLIELSRRPSTGTGGILPRS